MISILVPVKNDKRIFDLIKALKEQTFKDFEVLIADDSKKRLFNEKTKIDLSEKIGAVRTRYFHVKPMSIADKLQFMIEKSHGDIIAITESDCIPSEKWLKELLSEYENDKTVVVGGQITSENINYGNLLMPKKAFSISHDNSLKIADDTDWFLTLEEKGYIFKKVDKAIVTHYKCPVKRLFRSFIYAKEHSHIYIKHKKYRKLLNSIAFQSLTSLFSFCTAILLIIYGIYYRLKFMVIK